MIAVSVAKENLIGKAERLAIRPRAAHDGLVIIVAHGVGVSEGLEKWRVAILHVEELHGLPRVMRRATRRRVVSGGNRRLEVVETARRVVPRYVLCVDGAIDLLNHLEILMD